MLSFENLTESYSKLEIVKYPEILTKEIPNINYSKKKSCQSTVLSKSISIVIPAITYPLIAYADTFSNVYLQFIVIIDWLAVGVISAAGIAWMFGHRSKGIELLIGAGIGYIIARKAMDIRDWLKIDVLGG